MPSVKRYALTPRVTFKLWLLLAALCTSCLLFHVVQGVQFNSHLMALIPEASTSKAIEQANQRLISNADQQLVLVFTSDKAHDDPAQFVQLANDIQHNALFSITPALANKQKAGLQELLPWRYFLLSDESQQRLQQGDSSIATQAVSRLYSPMASVFANNLIEDPLQLFFLWQLDVSPKTSFELEQPWLVRYTDNHVIRMLPLQLTQSAYDQAYQQAVMQSLQHLRQSLSQTQQLYVSGLIQHAAFAGAQAKREISTIGIGSLFGIVLLLGSVFRQVRALFIAFLPLAFGCAVALAVCLSLFEQVHLITLAFGASLVGLSIDYPLHYLCAEREHTATTTHKSTLRRVFPGLALGLVSSVAAFGLQAAAPFPGLRQMAIFSASGLVGAWLTVVLLLPALPAQNQLSNSHYQTIIRCFKHLNPRWPHIENPVSRVAILLLLALAALGLSRLTFDDNIRQLQTSPSSLIEQETRVALLSERGNTGQFFIIENDSEQALLNTEQQLTLELKTLKTQNLITGFSALSQFVPSYARQQHNKQLYAEQVFAPSGLLTQFVERSGLNNIASQAEAAFHQAENQTLLTISDRLTHSSASLERLLWLGEINGRYYSVVTLSGIQGQAGLNALTHLAMNNSDIHFIDRVSHTSTLLSDYKQQIIFWLGCAYALIGLMLYCRYGRAFWRVLAAPASATMITLAALAFAEIPVTIFHSLALLLILGIGLDAGIFLTESKRSEHAWLAVSLSACTTLLAFGLLSLSQTPVLHFFGLTVLIGIFSVWCMTPCFIEKPQTRNN